MRKVILFTTLLFAIQLNAQDLNEEDWGSWIMLYGTNKISNGLDVITEFRLHHYKLFKDLDNQFIRLGLTYELTPGISVTAGYIHQYSQTRNKINISENRPYEEITLKNKFKKFKIAHRYRLEHQWINILGSTKFNNRFRYRFRITHPLSEHYYLMAMNELFLNFQDPIFNQNRLQMGLGYAFDPNLKLELGYLKNHFNAANFDILRIGIIFNTDLRKQPKSD
ncbi:MAG: DUF2490 domain-containing protein [Maribacter sp.]|nr:DUF2490 domain-containing protein [Maribacter sp.]